MTAALSSARTRTVSEVAAESGVAPSAVRFYEKHGVVEAERTAGNQRRFGAAAACRIEVARLAQRVGLTVREIAELFAGLPAEPRPEDWQRVADRLVAEAEHRVAMLTSQLDALGSGARPGRVTHSPRRGTWQRLT